MGENWKTNRRIQVLSRLSHFRHFSRSRTTLWRASSNGEIGLEISTHELESATDKQKSPLKASSAEESGNFRPSKRSLLVEGGDFCLSRKNPSKTQALIF